MRVQKTEFDLFKYQFTTFMMNNAFSLMDMSLIISCLDSSIGNRNENANNFSLQQICNTFINNFDAENALVRFWDFTENCLPMFDLSNYISSFLWFTTSFKIMFSVIWSSLILFLDLTPVLNWELNSCEYCGQLSLFEGVFFP